jgi:galactokinase
MTGGGFGGCVLALVEADAVDATVQAVEAAYEAAGFGAPSAFVAVACDGARRL